MTLQNDMPANDNEKIIEELGGEWNSSYGHWEFRLSAKRPILTINPDEALELSSRITDYATRQRIEVLKLTQRDFTRGESSDAFDEGRTCEQFLNKQLLTALEATLIDKGDGNATT